MADPKRANNVQRIQKLLDIVRSLDSDGFGDYVSSFQPHLALVSADEFDANTHHHHPRVVLSYTVQLEHCNRMHNMHGGAMAALFDFCTSLALAMTARDTDDAGNVADAAEDDDDEEDIIKSWRRLGVSRTLAVTYVRPAPCDTDVLIECEQVHAGQRMSSLRGIMRRRSDGAVLATCEHGKVNTEPPPSKI